MPVRRRSESVASTRQGPLHGTAHEQARGASALRPRAAWANADAPNVSSGQTPRTA